MPTLIALSLDATNAAHIDTSRDFWIDKITTDIFQAHVPRTHYSSGFVQLLLTKLEKYSAEDLQKLYADFFYLKAEIFKEADKPSREFWVTAGGPGTGKSTILPRLTAQKTTKFAHLDFDRVVLKQMRQSYQKDVANQVRSPEEAYNHWREASLFFTDVLMTHALQEKYAVAFSATMTAPKSYIMFQGVKSMGYDIKLIHITCPNDVRFETDRRKKEEDHFYQCTEKDLRTKGEDFYMRLDQYAKNCDCIEFWYRPDYGTSILVATKQIGRTVQFMEGRKAEYANIKTEHNRRHGVGYFESYVEKD